MDIYDFPTSKKHLKLLGKKYAPPPFHPTNLQFKFELSLQVNKWKIVYLNCWDRYEDIVIFCFRMAFILNSQTLSWCHIGKARDCHTTSARLVKCSLVIDKATENEQLCNYSLENYWGLLILCCEIVLNRLLVRNATVLFSIANSNTHPLRALVNGASGHATASAIHHGLELPAQPHSSLSTPDLSVQFQWFSFKWSLVC